jgi:transposase
MYIQYISRKVKGKVYTSVVLAESYRENGKMKRRIISTLTNWPQWLTNELQKILRGGVVTSLDDLPYRQGKSFGAIYVLHQIARRIGLEEALGKSTEGRLSLFQIYARLLTQGSRLYAATEWARQQAVSELLGLDNFNEDHLYHNLEWLADHQPDIEKKLFQHMDQQAKIVYLYDVTSSYFEGTKNELADYGYNRDGKKGKMQIVIGLLCNEQGEPVSVEVFKGNTSDMKTVSDQLHKLKDDFGVEKVAFVGDKGMLKSKQIEEIKDIQWYYITSLTKPQIRNMLNTGAIQMALFEDELTEVTMDNIRYILRRNPIRAEQMRASRAQRIERVKTKIQQKNTYLVQHPKAKVSVAIKNIEQEVGKMKLSGCLTVAACKNKREIELSINEQDLEQIQMLDGCYVIKTDMKKADANKQVVHDRYKDLCEVEHAFRTLKTGLEEIRPIYVRKEKRTRGHVFVCMLAYKLIFHIWKYFKDDRPFTQQYILECLDKINYIEYQFKGSTIKQLPKIFNQDQQIILDRLGITLPGKV